MDPIPETEHGKTGVSANEGKKCLRSQDFEPRRSAEKAWAKHYREGRIEKT